MQRKRTALLAAGALVLVVGLGALWYFNRPLIWPLDDREFAMIIPADQSADEAIRRAREACAPISRHCGVIGWSDRASAPRDFHEWEAPGFVEAEVFAYRVEREPGAADERVSFACRRFPATPPQACFEYGNEQHPTQPIHLPPAR